MALSSVTIRMFHGNSTDQISFSGNGIKLLDLKKEIVDIKKFSTQLDFDLQITDENGNKEYVDDNEVVPKNSSLVVKRISAKNPKFGLIARLNNRNANFSSNVDS